MLTAVISPVSPVSWFISGSPIRQSTENALRQAANGLRLRNNGDGSLHQGVFVTGMETAGTAAVRTFDNDVVTEEIIGAAIEVHRIFGPGLLESTYEQCLCFELSLRGVAFQRQVALPLEYKSQRIANAYRLDLVIDNKVLVELKAVEKLLPLHEAQVLTYLKLAGFDRGLLINFNSVPLKSGIRRLVRQRDQARLR